jgi:hypothetical protein
MALQLWKRKTVFAGPPVFGGLVFYIRAAKNLRDVLDETAKNAYDREERSIRSGILFRKEGCLYG